MTTDTLVARDDAVAAVWRAKQHLELMRDALDALVVRATVERQCVSYEDVSTVLGNIDAAFVELSDARDHARKVGV
jgi:hypothetical protein